MKVKGEENERLTVAFVDSGAGETIISAELALSIGAQTYGLYRAYTASNQIIEGQFASVTITIDEQEFTLEVGVTDTPFQCEYSDEEGVDVIIGLDLLQDAKAKLDFGR